MSGPRLDPPPPASRQWPGVEFVPTEDLVGVADGRDPFAEVDDADESEFLARTEIRADAPDPPRTR